MLLLLNNPNSNVACSELCLKAPRTGIIFGRRSPLLMIIFKEPKTPEMLRNSDLGLALQNNDSCKYGIRV
jgi:hypothetical protein